MKIRRLGDKVMNDDEMIDYYSRLVAGLGGRTVAHYRNAIFLVLSDDRKRWLMDDTIEETFYLVSKPHSIRVEGFPLIHSLLMFSRVSTLLTLPTKKGPVLIAVVMASGISSAKQSVNMLIC